MAIPQWMSLLVSSLSNFLSYTIFLNYRHPSLIILIAYFNVKNTPLEFNLNHLPPSFVPKVTKHDINLTIEDHITGYTATYFSWFFPILKLNDRLIGHYMAIYVSFMDMGLVLCSSDYKNKNRQRISWYTGTNTLKIRFH